MCLLLETVKVEDGQPQNIAYHNERMNRSVWELRHKKTCFDLERIINVPGALTKGVLKCRIKYSTEVLSVEFEKYVRKPVRSLKLVECNDIEYAYKFAGRSHLNRLLSQKGDCDDILIVKNGYITDTSFSNIVFFDGEKFITPSTPLLNGTKRKQLLDKGVITAQPITPGDIGKFYSARIINALNDIFDGDDISISKIY